MNEDKYLLLRRMEFPEIENFSEEKMNHYFATLMKTAKVDGLVPEEDRLIDTLMELFSLNKDEIELIKYIVNKGTDLVELIDRLEDPGLHVCLFRDAYRVALANNQVTKKEANLLNKLQARLTITEQEAKRIQKIVNKDQELQARLANLLKDVKNRQD